MYHIIRENRQQGEINVQYIGTNDKVADVFTRALPPNKFHMFRAMLNLGFSSLSGRVENISK